MPRLEPALLPVVTDLERGLRTLGVPFAVVGALVPELLLDVRPARRTNDGAGVPFEYTGAYLLGIDGRPFLGAKLSQAAATVLDRFADSDSEGGR
jgi:hypothetical protein